MKKIFLIGILITALGCKSSKVDSDDENKNESSPITETSAKDTYEVSGFVTASSSYCGGARPSDAMLRDITSPKPLPNTEFYIRVGKENDITKKIITSFRTDEQGKFTIKLPPGDYIIIEDNRKDKKYYNEVLQKHAKATSSYTAMDTACLDNWLKGGLFQFEIIDRNLESISWDIHKGCFFSAPCVQYTGPYPP